MPVYLSSYFKNGAKTNQFKSASDARNLLKHDIKLKFTLLLSFPLKFIQSILQ